MTCVVTAFCLVQIMIIMLIIFEALPLALVSPIANQQVNISNAFALFINLFIQTQAHINPLPAKTAREKTEFPLVIYIYIFNFHSITINVH